MIAHDIHQWEIHYLRKAEIFLMMKPITDITLNILPHGSHYYKTRRHLFPQSLLMINIDAPFILNLCIIAEMNCYDKCIYDMEFILVPNYRYYCLHLTIIKH